MEKNLGNKSILKMENLFYECKSLQLVYISKINFENVSIDNLFQKCVALVEVFISDVVVNSISMNSMFYSCKTLKKFYFLILKQII